MGPECGHLAVRSMCPDSFSVSVSMYMKRREFILPSLLSLYLDTRVRGWRLLLAAHLCLMALTMRESPGLAPSRSPACSAFSLISFSRLTCRISIISTISTTSTIYLYRILTCSILSTSSRYSFSVSVRPAPRYPSSAAEKWEMRLRL